MESRKVVNKNNLAVVLNIVLIIVLIILYGMYNLAVQESSEKDQALENMRNQLTNIYDASLDANEELAYLKQQQGYIVAARLV